MCKMKTRMCVCEGGARTSAAIAVVVVVIADAIVTPAVASACNKNNKNWLFFKPQTLHALIQYALL